MIKQLFESLIHGGNFKILAEAHRKIQTATFNGLDKPPIVCVLAVKFEDCVDKSCQPLDFEVLFRGLRVGVAVLRPEEKDIELQILRKCLLVQDTDVFIHQIPKSFIGIVEGVDSVFQLYLWVVVKLLNEILSKQSVIGVGVVEFLEVLENRYDDVVENNQSYLVSLLFDFGNLLESLVVVLDPGLPIFLSLDLFFICILRWLP